MSNRFIINLISIPFGMLFVPLCDALGFSFLTTIVLLLTSLQSVVKSYSKFLNEDIHEVLLVIRNLSYYAYAKFDNKIILYINDKTYQFESNFVVST